MSVSVFTVSISDSGFLAEVKSFLAKGVSTLLLSREGDLQNVTNSLNGFLFLSCFLSTMSLGVVSSLNSVAQFFLTAEFLYENNNLFQYPIHVCF